MKKSFAVLAMTGTVALSLASPLVMANTEVGVEATSIRSQQLASQVFRDYGGRYRMQDGSLLRIVKQGGRVFAEADDESRVEVKATSNNRLVSLSGRTFITFGDADSGNVVVSKSRAHAELVASTGVQPKLI